MKYIVTYDLRSPGRDYETLWNELRRLSGLRCLESVWSVDVNSSTAADLRDHLKKFVDNNDRLLVLRLGDWASWNVLRTPE